MEVTNNLNEILLSHTWQENLNTWTFREQVILIKNFSTPNFTKIVEYSIEKQIDGKFVLKTNKDFFGDLLLTVRYENPLPKIILRSTINKNTYYELHAFKSFTPDQILLIENKIKVLRTVFEIKKNEIEDVILHLMKAPGGDKKTIKEYESSIRRTEEKIKMLETVVHSTINVASNFQAYHQNITMDIRNLQEEIGNLLK